jgi:hypothetical protein
MNSATLTPAQLKELLGNMTQKDVLLSPEFNRAFNLLILSYNERIDAITRKGGRPKSHPFLTLSKKLSDGNMKLTCSYFIDLYVTALTKRLDTSKISSLEHRWILDTGGYLYQQAISRIIENRLKAKENETDKTIGGNTEA